MTFGGIESLPDDSAWPLEKDSIGYFRWTKPAFSLPVPNGEQFVTFAIASVLPENHLLWAADERAPQKMPLAEGWHTINFRVPTGTRRLSFNIGAAFSPENDDRSLGIMIRKIRWHDDQALYELLQRRHDNLLLNNKEYAEGAEVLTSYPPYLRVTLSKICNIANEIPCVYCSWDWAKKLEIGSPTFDMELIDHLGDYVALAHEVTDCSYGEPPLEKHFGDAVDAFTFGDRAFEFTSNGQTLSEKIRKKMLGKSIRLYVSIDSDSAEGYERYRDSRFNLIIENLRALCQEKRATENLPYVTVSFIVMRSNKDRVASFIQLMKDVGIDRVCFRSLYREDHLDQKIQDRPTGRFDYDQEFLNLDELREIGKICRATAAQLAIEVVTEWNDFVSNSGRIHTSKLPLCSEPWKTACVFTRGITPCCYGREPIVNWTEMPQDTPENNMRRILNGPEFRELRRDLAAGRLGAYCERAQGCPIVKAHKEGLARTE